MQMEGKTVLITGSTDGVGRYVASELARQGAHVLIHGRDAGRAKALADDIKARGYMAAATEEILNDNGIRAQGSADVLKIWETKDQQAR